jgi:hypothetical protein
MVQEVIKRCATDDVFHKLLSIFPDEDGYGDYARYFSQRLMDIARAVNDEGIEVITDGSPGLLSKILKRCIDSARQKGVYVDDNKFG